MTAAVAPGSNRAGITGTVVAHGALIALAVVTAHRAAPLPSVVYEVNLVAAPLPAPAARNLPTEATPATTAEDVAPPLTHKRTVPPKPKAKPAAAPAPKRVAKVPETSTPATPAKGAAPSTGQDALSLQQTGFIFPYPEYLRNIENQIFRHWDHSMFRPGFDAKVAFVILKDGSVTPSSIYTTKSSGSFQFDLNARGAIESAAAQGGFGPLPSGFDGASLPILFDFSQVAGGGGHL
jgi:outer membrane biosynthesis protein TonB